MWMIALTRIVPLQVEAVRKEPKECAVRLVRRVLGRTDTRLDLRNLGIREVGIPLDEVKVEIIDDEYLILFAMKLAAGAVDIAHPWFFF